jgi:hypothetical protein
MLFKISKKSLLYKNEYYSAITISPKPPKNSALGTITKTITEQQLSPFTQNKKGCHLYFLHPDCCHDIIEYENLETLIEYFTLNDISIDYNLSKLLKKDEQDLIFYIKLKLD